MTSFMPRRRAQERAALHRSASELGEGSTGEYLTQPACHHDARRKRAQLSGVEGAKARLGKSAGSSTRRRTWDRVAEAR